MKSSSYRGAKIFCLLPILLNGYLGLKSPHFRNFTKSASNRRLISCRGWSMKVLAYRSCLELLMKRRVRKRQVHQLHDLLRGCWDWPRECSRMRKWMNQAQIHKWLFQRPFLFSKGSNPSISWEVWCKPTRCSTQTTLRTQVWRSRSRWRNWLLRPPLQFRCSQRQ